MSLVSTALSHLVLGIERGTMGGLNAGIRYAGQTAKILEWAYKTNNAQALEDCMKVVSLWISESVDELANPLPAVTEALKEAAALQVPHIDPWEGSRREEQRLWAMYAAQAGLVSISVPSSAIPTRAASIPAKTQAPVATGPVPAAPAPEPAPETTPDQVEWNEDPTPQVPSL